jgi:hypothetical protein
MSPDRIDAISRELADPTSRRRVLRLLGVGAAGTAATMLGFPDALAKPNKKQEASKNLGPFNTLSNIPLKAHEQGRNFKGTLDIVRFEERAGGIVAIGELTGKVTGKDVGNRQVERTLELPVSFTAPAAARAQATCEILDLVLGPIDLNLLGLRLQVNQIHIQLTAQQGGGLLGDLLCAIANLLNGGGPLSQIVDLLNQILAVLQGL